MSSLEILVQVVGTVVDGGRLHVETDEKMTL